FRNSEALRRLLKFLAEKRLAGEADQLKEYSVGIDALGKPATYDPRQDSTGRIQVGRLRNKLPQYYRTEGKQDQVIVDLPKGRFKLTYEELPAPPVVSTVALEENPSTPIALAMPPAPTRRMSVSTPVLALGVALALCLTWAVIATAQLIRARE